MISPSPKGSKNLLFIAHRIPYPPNKGDKIRSFNEIKYLSERDWKINLCALADDPEDLSHVSALKAYCETVFVEPMSPRIQKLKSIVAPLRGRPLSAVYFYNRKLQKKIDSVLDACPMDAVLCFSGPMAEYVFKSRILSNGLKSKDRIKPRLVMDLVDVDSDKWTQYAKWMRWPMSWVYRMEGRLLANYEKRTAEAFDAAVLVSSAEAEVFRNRTKLENKIYDVANGVDLEYFSPSTQSQISRSGAPRLVFCGAMDYFPNIDAVCWFVQDVMPLVRKELGSVELVIVGGNPAAEVLKLKAVEGVIVTGRVPDVRPYLHAADLSVSPIRIARGIQNKVLEAMAMGKAVVATPQAFEGIEAEPGKDLIVAEAEPNAFAEAVATLLRDRSKLPTMGRSARAKVESLYDWESRLASLEGLLKHQSTGSR